MAEIELGRAAAFAVPTIILLLAGLFGISYVVSTLFKFPVFLGLPLGVRIIGGVLVIAGLAVAGWTFRYRRPSEMMLSTYVTFTKLLRRRPIAERLGRTEPLVVVGPQRYTRNPLYFGVIVMTFGWALAGDYTFVLVAAVLLLLWFRAVLIPFEERELSALFGGQYAKYKDQVPMLVPFTMRKKRPAPPE
jgi:protein-S-isoprenylcysteine O-methyltransferase Ste14